MGLPTVPTTTTWFAASFLPAVSTTCIMLDLFADLSYISDLAGIRVLLPLSPWRCFQNNFPLRFGYLIISLTARWPFVERSLLHI